MSKGEIKTARNILASNGRISSTRSGVLRTFGFNGNWTEFESAFREYMHTDPAHPQLVILTDPNWQGAVEGPCHVRLDPKKYAEAAVSFVLGEESQQAITPYSGTYGKHFEVIGQLGANICESICSVYYPQQTDGIIMYQAERSLMYQASSGFFTIYGE